MRALSLLFVALLPGAALANISVSPVLIDKHVTPTDNVLELVISNPSTRPMNIELSAAPLVHDEKGAPKEAREAYAYDISKHIRFEQPKLTIAPRRWKRVRAHVDLPDRKGGGYAMIFVRGIEADAATTGLAQALRVGVVVELILPDRGSTGFTMTEVAQQKDSFRIAVRNEGEHHAKPSGTAVLRNAAGEAVWTGALSPANVFPGLVREFVFPPLPPKLRSGQYVAEFQLEGSDVVEQRKVAVIDGQPILERKQLAKRSR